MDLFEYQGKELFVRAGLSVPRSQLARTMGEADELGPQVGFPLVAKAQVLAGGRGKAGGVQLVRDVQELHAAAERILTMTIKGQPVTALLLEEVADIAREFYLAITLDRHAKRPLLMVSTKGGMEIEQVAREVPAALHSVHIDPLLGLRDFQVRRLALWTGLSAEQQKVFAAVVRAVWSLYQGFDAKLVEINPLCLTPDGRFIAIDAKVTIDDNALHLHPEFATSQGVADGRERRAKEAGLDYVSLDGDIGVLGNGAGLVMSLLDLVAAAGGKAADFLDLHGGVKQQRIEAAFEILVSDERVSAILMTIFAAITRCDEVAHALLGVLDATKTSLPVVVRLSGTHSEQGRAILAKAARPNLFAAASITEAVEKAVALAKSRSGEQLAPVAVAIVDPGSLGGGVPQAGAEV